ncbi:MAG: flavin reductase family protein [Pseudomonadota bacterium]
MGDDFDIRTFRTALGGFTTGVCVITTATGDGQIVGITANSFASVSLTPPLVLWSPAKSSRRHDVFAEAPHFAIHVLATDQEHIASGFVKEANAFSGFDWGRNAHGVPVIKGCVSRFECNTHTTYPGGDHTIIIGAVDRFSQNDISPLVFAKGKYTGLA